MLACIEKILKRGKRKCRHENMGKKTPWGFNQQQLFKSHTDVGKLYVVENFEKRKENIKFPR